MHLLHQSSARGLVGFPGVVSRYIRGTLRLVCENTKTTNRAARLQSTEQYTAVWQVLHASGVCGKVMRQCAHSFVRGIDTVSNRFFGEL